VKRRRALSLLLFSFCLGGEEIRVQLFAPLNPPSATAVRAADGLIGVVHCDDIPSPLAVPAVTVRAEAARLRLTPGLCGPCRRIVFPAARYRLTACGIDKSVQGVLEITPWQNGLRLVGHVELEDYVAGVLWGEGEQFREMEFLRALAVAVRSYALFSRIHPLNSAYHLVDSTRSAFFKGGPAPAVFTTACRLTRGRLLQKEGELVPGFFFAESGGRTWLPRQLWGDDLRGFKSAFPVEAAGSRRVRLAKKEMLNLFGQGRPQVPVAMIDRDSEIELRAEDGSSRRFSKATIYRRGNRNDHRLWPSPYFRLREQGGEVELVFSGRGHQVGLSLSGAHALARRGWNADQILRYYFDID